MRIVLDTNMLVDALLSPGGTPNRLFQLIRQDKHLLVTSNYLLDELRDVTEREYLRKRIPPEDVDRLLANISAIGLLVTELPDVEYSSDNKDNPILATAISGKADLIVSGDIKHLLELGSVENIPILTASDT